LLFPLFKRVQSTINKLLATGNDLKVFRLRISRQLLNQQITHRGEGKRK
jgi:hypothetical protein